MCECAFVRELVQRQKSPRESRTIAAETSLGGRRPVLPTSHLSKGYSAGCVAHTRTQMFPEDKHFQCLRQQAVEDEYFAN